MSMKRHRAPVQGGYRRTTITIPEELASRVDAHIEKKAGLTLSAFVSEVLEEKLPIGRRRR